jgi:c-di-GMP-binding flagellar brake protein YcgR
MAVQRAGFFEVGITVVLEINGPEDTYTTQIESVRPDAFAVSWPQKKMELIPVELGQAVIVQITRRNNPYFFDTQVVSKGQGELGQVLMWLRRPPDTAGRQLRQFVRVSTVISDLQYWIEEDGKYGETHKGQILDISAGGCLIMSRTAIPVDATLLLKFTLERLQPQMMLNAKAIKCIERVNDVGVKTYRTGSQFLDPGPKDRDRLIKYVFQRERELKQKGVF